MTDGTITDRLPNPLFGRAESRDSVDTPATLKPLIVAAEAARDRMTLAMLEAIDAIMPAKVELVNYKFDDAKGYLVIHDATTGFGEDLDPASLENIGEMLRLLGQPYYDFDGDLTMSSVDDFGWERTKEFDAARAQAADVAAHLARDKWERSVKAVQQRALDGIWERMPSDVEALDFEWNSDEHCLQLVGTISRTGRTPQGTDGFAAVDDLARYLTEPAFLDLRCSELSGLYRHSR